MFKIAVLVSGGGSNLQAIINHINEGKLKCSIDIVIADRNCYGLERARLNNIKTILLDRKLYKENLFNEIDNILTFRNINLIVLAGFLSIVSESFVNKWNKKIINIHPSLLPRFGGKGMYGIKVHEAIIAVGDAVSGCTVHYVDASIDTGEIIMQSTVDVDIDDTAETLQKKVLIEEHRLLPLAIAKIIDSKNK
ncbi:phosphoribosylglycinamide formyltransferase [Fusobacterium sp. PH5-44]|uniref:phosphoribosylglycinamide formyltransferase n=1 Tax=unclassified Fusobacterium TaxID=2648384 RepID=UPI003D249562